MCSNIGSHSTVSHSTVSLCAVALLLSLACEGPWIPSVGSARGSRDCVARWIGIGSDWVE